MTAQNPIKEFYENHSLTYVEIAQKVGFKSDATVVQHANGTRGISAESAKKYHERLGIALESLRPDLWPPQGCRCEPPSTTTEASHASQ